MWTWATIEQEWLRGDIVDFAPQVVADAFKRAEKVLGADWVNNHRAPAPGVTARGAPAVLPVVRAGLLLRALGESPDRAFVERLKAGDHSAWTEIAALRIVRSDPGVILAIEAPAPGTTRRPDFTLTSNGERAYVEVEGIVGTAADERFGHVASALSDAIQRDMADGWSVAVSLTNLPTDAEVQSIRRAVRLELSSNPGVRRVLRPGSSRGVPAGMAEINVAPGESGTRSVSVEGPPMRMGLAGAFKHGAAQLPPGLPGIVVLHTGFKGPITPTTEPASLARKGTNTRVAAVVLIREWSDGRSVHLEAFTHLHPTPAVGLPGWLQDRLAPSIGEWIGGWLAP